MPQLIEHRRKNREWRTNKYSRLEPWLEGNTLTGLGTARYTHHGKKDKGGYQSEGDSTLQFRRVNPFSAATHLFSMRYRRN